MGWLDIALVEFPGWENGTIVFVLSSEDSIVAVVDRPADSKISPLIDIESV